MLTFPLVLIAALALAVPAAQADGDPASDYLITQSAYLSPFGGKVSSARAQALTRLLAEAKQRGYPLEVAVIVTRSDLGSVPVLFGKPQRYAKFLSQELFYYVKSELLVVMRNGYGVARAGRVPAAQRAALAALPAPGATNGDALVDAAVRGVIALAATHGLTLTASAPVAHRSPNRDRATIAAAVLAAGLLALALRLGWRRWRGPRDG